MSENQWGEETDEAPRKKRGIPKWLLFGCGGGCLVAVIVAVVLAVVGVRYFRDAFDAEKQWVRLDSVLPYGERPVGLEMQVGLPLGVMDQFILLDRNRNRQVTVMHFKRASDSDLEALFSESGQGAPFGLGEPENPTSGTVRIQGRETRCLRYSGLKAPGDVLGAGIRVDLTEPDFGMVVLDLRHGGEDPWTEEELASVLAPFDVWHTGQFDQAVPLPEGEGPAGDAVESPPDDPDEGDDGGK